MIPWLKRFVDDVAMGRKPSLVLSDAYLDHLAVERRGSLIKVVCFGEQDVGSSLVNLSRSAGSKFVDLSAPTFTLWAAGYRR